MSRKTKFVMLVVLTQTGSIAAGVWIQHSCFRWSVRESLLTQSLEALAREQTLIADLLARERSSLRSEARNERLAQQAEANPSIADSPAYLSDRFRRNVARLVSPNTGLIIVDADWRVRWQSTAKSAADPQALAVGDALPWTPSLGGSESTDPDGAGAFDSPHGPHFAVARPVPVSGGFLVLHQSEVSLENRVSALVSGLTGVTWMSLLWTSAFLGVCGFILVNRFDDEAERERSRSLNEAARQRRDLIRTRDAVIVGLAKLTESRDPDTGDHLERISLFATTLSTALMRHPEFMADITPSFIRVIGISAALHDIGKVGVEDRILLKPGRLTAAERAEMQRHSRIGGDCLREIERRLGRSNFLQMARDIAFSHHERWDGTGYPDGLLDEQIPLAARIVAICDVYDALSSRRVYKEPLSHDRCVAVIVEGSGTQFDPRIVGVWLTVAAKFREIAEQYASNRTQTFRESGEDGQSPAAAATEGSGYSAAALLESVQARGG